MHSVVFSSAVSKLHEVFDCNLGFKHGREEPTGRYPMLRDAGVRAGDLVSWPDLNQLIEIRPWPDFNQLIQIWPGNQISGPDADVT